MGNVKDAKNVKILGVKEGNTLKKKKINLVTVRWFDGYKEDFRCTEIRFGNALLWMRLENGNNRHIPLNQVRWFGTSIKM